MAERIRGKVAKWKEENGYGFIKVNGRNKDVFVHFSQIQNNGGRNYLPEDTEVEFEIGEGREGKDQALNVMVL